MVLIGVSTVGAAREPAKQSLIFEFKQQGLLTDDDVEKIQPEINDLCATTFDFVNEAEKIYTMPSERWEKKDIELLNRRGEAIDAAERAFLRSKICSRLHMDMDSVNEALSRSLVSYAKSNNYESEKFFEFIHLGINSGKTFREFWREKANDPEWAKPVEFMNFWGANL